MKGKKYIKILLWIITFLILIFSITVLFINPIVENKVSDLIKENAGNYQVAFKKLHVSIFTSGVKLETITICNKPEIKSDLNLNGEIALIELKGISLWKIFYNNDIDIDEVTISKSNIIGVMQFSNDSTHSLISPRDIHLGKLNLDKINLTLKSSSSYETYSISEGDLYVSDLQILKNDTISSDRIKEFDFKADQLLSVSSDSLYTHIINGMLYSSNTNTFQVRSFFIKPNYEVYDFTARLEFQGDCIQAEFNNIYCHDFSFPGYLKTGSVICSYVEIGRVDVSVFRDLRKESSHKYKPMFQELIYDYPGKIMIDSMGLLTGNVLYTEHVKNANHPGRISFNKIDAKIYKITNDTIFRNKEAYFKLESNAFLMGKGKVSLSVKAPLFDRNNSITMSGTLSGMEAKELNPFLERNEFLYVTSGKLDEMKFYLSANNKKATGKMTMLYHGIDIAIKSRRTDDTTAIKEKIVSWIANRKIINSNPLPGKEVREGIIDFERNPETFIFNYCIKSVLTGVKSTVFKNHQGKVN